MSETLVNNIDKNLLDGVTIHVSRFDPANLQKNEFNILYVHDMPNDPMYVNINYNKFDMIVFVTAWQYSQFAKMYDLPNGKCRVIYNCTGLDMKFKKRTLRWLDPIQFVYHTTPHRGLVHLVDNFHQIRNVFPNAHLNVHSSFKVYGWEEQDNIYMPLYDRIKNNPNMTYHGYTPRAELYQILPNYDVFFYPCTWAETSCISLIEAVKAGMMCLFPSEYALPETGIYSNCFSYDSKENLNNLTNDKRLKFFKDVAEKIRFGIFKDGSWTNNPDSLAVSKRHRLSEFINNWETALKDLRR